MALPQQSQAGTSSSALLTNNPSPSCPWGCCSLPEFPWCTGMKDAQSGAPQPALPAQSPFVCWGQHTGLCSNTTGQTRAQRFSFLPSTRIFKKEPIFRRPSMEEGNKFQLKTLKFQLRAIKSSNCSSCISNASTGDRPSCPSSLKTSPKD